MRPEDREKRNTRYRVRDDDRDIDDALDDPLSGKVASCKEVCKRHAEYECYGGCGECRVHRQEDGFYYRGIACRLDQARPVGDELPEDHVEERGQYECEDHETEQ